MIRFSWLQTLAMITATLTGPSGVLGFVSNGGHSNAVLDALSEMKYTMNKNQELTMDILKDLRATVKQLVKANVGDTQPIQPSTGVASAQQQIPCPTVHEFPAQPTAPQIDLDLSRQEIRPDSIAAQSLWIQEPPRQKSRQPEFSIPAGLRVLHPDLPFEAFSQHKPPVQRKHHQHPPPSDLRGLVALPPDQPFMSCGQQLEIWQNERRRKSPDFPSSTVGIQPDQPFQEFRRQQHAPQHQQNPQVDGNVKVVGIQPDQPFGHLNQQRQITQHSWPHMETGRTPKETKIIAFRPDQLL